MSMGSGSSIMLCVDMPEIGKPILRPSHTGQPQVSCRLNYTCDLNPGRDSSGHILVLDYFDGIPWRNRCDMCRENFEET